MAPLSPAPVSSASGVQGSAATTITVTLPSYTTGDFILLIVARNTADASAFTYSAAVSTATELPTGGSGSRQITAIQIVPNSLGQTSFTVTGTSSLWSWWIANYSGASVVLPVNGAGLATGNSTLSAIPVPEVSLGYIATGNELVISAATTNSTAIWTTDANTQFDTTSGSATLMVDAVNLTAGVLTAVSASMDRGNAGTNRNQNSLALVLQQDPGGVVNLLSNPSFESGTTLATGWVDEHSTATEATYSLVGTGVVDGTRAQKFTYSGVPADGGTAKTELYQAPISASPGQLLIFSVWLSGSFTAVYAILGIEGFDSGSTYISEVDTTITSLSGTPTLYTVAYLCPPNTSYVAAYIQCPGIAPSTVLSVTMDAAQLVVGVSGTSSIASVASLAANVTQAATAPIASITSVSASVVQRATNTIAAVTSATAFVTERVSASIGGVTSLAANVVQSVTASPAAQAVIAAIGSSVASGVVNGVAALSSLGSVVANVTQSVTNAITGNSTAAAKVTQSARNTISASSNATSHVTQVVSANLASAGNLTANVVQRVTAIVSASAQVIATAIVPVVIAIIASQLSGIARLFQRLSGKASNTNRLSGRASANDSELGGSGH